MHEDVFKANGWTCQLCGHLIDPSTPYPDPRFASLDHIIPLSVPGSPGHVRSNLQLACLTCNVSKGNRTAS